MKYWRKTLDWDRVKTGSYQVNISRDRCKGCRLCIEFCPKKVLSESPELNLKGYHPAYAADGKACLNCGLCELLCPEFAISVTPGKDGQAVEQ